LRPHFSMSRESPSRKRRVLPHAVPRGQRHRPAAGGLLKLAEGCLDVLLDPEEGRSRLRVPGRARDDQHRPGGRPHCRTSPADLNSPPATRRTSPPRLNSPERAVGATGSRPRRLTVGDARASWDNRVMATAPPTVAGTPTRHDADEVQRGSDLDGSARRGHPPPAPATDSSRLNSARPRQPSSLRPTTRATAAVSSTSPAALIAAADESTPERPPLAE